jgi:gliding-associated putative ABC transporter substrate-binding component GldG
MNKGAYIKRKHLRNFVLFLVILVAVNIAASFTRARLDLTEGKRYTLSEPTRRMLKNLDGTVRIKVFLKGKFPSGFRHLSESVRELLEEFRRYAGHRISWQFVDPLAGLSDSAQARVKDSLTAMGIMPYNVKAQQDLSQGMSVQLIFPGALVDYKGHQLAVNLLQPQPGLDPLKTLNHSAALLEYDFMHAIAQLSRPEPPLVAYMLGNGECLTPEAYDALNVLQQNYRLDTLNLADAPFIPSRYEAIVLLRPEKRFTEEEKLKIDQYVMHGGKILWAVNPVNASMDSLQAKAAFLAFDQGLNLEDMLFDYGVRINPDLVQDLDCFSIPVTVGHLGNRPQIQRLPWPFAPLLRPSDGSAITRNMDVVLGQFASSIDTTAAKGVAKTVLLATSPRSRTLGTPLRVSLQSVKVRADPREFTASHLAVAVLLEGSFPSVFRGRMDQQMQAAVQLRFRQPYKDRSVPTRMIVVSDANMFLNAVTGQSGPLAMGMDPYTRQLFANREFFENCLTYLTDTTGVMQARNKDLRLRLLDSEKVAAEKSTWQVLDFLIPIALVLLFAVVFQFIRQRKYTEE